MHIASKRGVETSNHKGNTDSHLNLVRDTQSFLLAYAEAITVCFLAAYRRDEGLRGYSAVIKA
jgi:hypothetical protein